MGQWITDTIASWGYVGIVVAMFLENLFPPIPSEVVMPAAGLQARHDQMSLWGVILAGSAGSLLGAWFWFEVARWLGQQRLLGWISRHGPWIGISRKEAGRSLNWFQRHGPVAVLVGRLVPGVRTLISVPAGFSGMPRRTFLLWTAIGTAGWTSLLAMLGWWLQDHVEQAESIISGVGTLVIAGLIALWLIQLIRHHRQSHHASST